MHRAFPWVVVWCFRISEVVVLRRHRNGWTWAARAPSGSEGSSWCARTGRTEHCSRDASERRARAIPRRPVVAREHVVLAAPALALVRMRARTPRRGAATLRCRRWCGGGPVGLLSHAMACEPPPPPPMTGHPFHPRLLPSALALVRVRTRAPRLGATTLRCRRWRGGARAGLLWPASTGQRLL